MASCLFIHLTDWLMNWLVDWLVDWLTDVSGWLSGAVLPVGKGNYWTLDPNCEKMFDNGNFRRKRKRRSDASGSKSDETRSVGTLSGSLSPSMPAPSPPESDAAGEAPRGAPAPCLAGFFSSMAGLSSPSPSSSSPSPAVRHGSLGLLGELSSRNIGAYQPEHAHGHAGEQHESAHGVRGAHHGAFSTGPQSAGHFSGHFYNGFSVNSLIYPREGTELWYFTGHARGHEGVGMKSRSELWPTVTSITAQRKETILNNTLKNKGYWLGCVVPG